MTRKISIESPGKCLKNLRSRQGVTQKEIGDLLLISTSTVAEIENENIQLGIDRMIDVCNHFKITPDEFLEINVDPDKIAYAPLQSLVPKLNKLANKEDSCAST